MDVKLTLVCVVLMVLAAQNLVEAEFLYNRYLPKQEELASRGLKCIPGRTVIKIQEKPVAPDTSGSDDDSNEDGRRTHTRFTTNDEFCQVCICSVHGEDEFCSKRPAMNVNECMRMATLMDRFQKNEPFDHERTLSYMIRRDYIWHNEEIPYEENARCKRAHSYYSNSVVANDSLIEVASDINSLLDYSNKSVCFYCVCSAEGYSAGCLSRSPWFCEYYRIAREPNAARDRYRAMFQQDRPAYFRQLSYRLRRTMDDGMFDLIETGGDSLCCGHSDGHRRQMHHQVRNKIRLLKNRVNKENLMGGSPVGEEQSEQKCVPFVSTYTDCNEDNKCGECESCTCTANGKWTCETVHECTSDQEQEINVADIDSALDSILDEIKQKDNPNEKVMYAPKPLEPEKLIDASEQEYKFRDGSDELKHDPTFLSMLLRDKKVYKRSLTENNTNDSNETVIFHHTIDEINEDTLKSSNTSGTLEAAKVDNMLMSASRRATQVLNNSTSKSLQIEYTPPIQNQHVADNKVDTPAIHDDQVDLLVHHKLYEMVGNKSQLTRDKDLSKLLVNELKGGAEIIGDQSSPVISNITFTSENDTLTAMAFIAGNLLNKLWNMEKDANDNSMETENLKHKKINDLLELFKEPLNLRQETFLKKALEQLSAAIENKEGEKNSLCKNLEEIKEASGLTSDKKQTKKINESNIILENVTRKSNQVAATAEALGKISNVLDLIKKYENIQNSLSDLKSESGNMKSSIRTNSDKDLTKKEKVTLNMFGNILESLTKLLIPNKKNKKVINAVKSRNLLIGDTHVGEKIKNLNITGMSVTAKDRIVLDYLAHIQNSPNCLFTKQQEKPLPNIEGDILLNLSEFFKIKSMSDFLKLTEAENKKQESIIRSKPSMTEQIDSSDFYTTEKNFRTTEKSKAGKFEITKEKLKAHLKNILEDLTELQNVSGQSKKGKNIEIADALPCIYNLLNGDIATSNTDRTNIQLKKEKPNKLIVDPVNKVAGIFNNLQKELKRTAQTRRTNVGPSGPRPKSAIVWERTIKGLDKLDKIKQKLKTRRNLEEDINKSKSLEDINKLIDQFESLSSNTYKSMAYLAEVPAAEILTLLRTLSADTKKYIKTIENIKDSLETNTNLTPDQHNTIFEFIDNANLNVNLNKKIIANLNKPKKNRYLSTQKVKPIKQISMYKPATEIFPTKSNGVILSRDQIINQLIKNRMQYYLRLKEMSGDSKGSINMGLAKKILLYLEIGNYNLARELYKLFVTENKIKNKPVATSSSQAPDSVNYGTLNQLRIGRRITDKVPLIQFEEPKGINKELSWLNQERLIKQLVNIKNMRT